MSPDTIELWTKQKSTDTTLDQLPQLSAAQIVPDMSRRDEEKKLASCSSLLWEAAADRLFLTESRLLSSSSSLSCTIVSVPVFSKSMRAWLAFPMSSCVIGSAGIF